MKIKRFLKVWGNRLKFIRAILLQKQTIVLENVEREDTPLDIIVLYPNEISFFGPGPENGPIKYHQVKAINEFKKAWKDSYSKSFSGKEEGKKGARGAS